MSTNDRYPELAALDRYRVEQDMTYRDLGQAVGVPWRSLYSLLTNSKARPYDRTLFKIQRFLNTLPARRRRGPTSKAAAVERAS